MLPDILVRKAVLSPASMDVRLRWMPIMWSGMDDDGLGRPAVPHRSG